MARVQTASELRRLAHLAQVTGVLRARMPEASHHRFNLNDVVKLCKALIASRPCRDCHDVRDEILTIASLWDLASDHLDEQSDELLAYLAEFCAS
jgi:hypothetical protein